MMKRIWGLTAMAGGLITAPALAQRAELASGTVRGTPVAWRRRRSDARQGQANAAIGP